MMIFCCLSIAGIAQTVFTDNFNRASISPGGTPSLTLTSVNTGSGSSTISGSSFLQINNGGSAGRSYVHGPLSGYDSPFTGTLANNQNIVTWTFNMRYNRTTVPSGFDNGNYGTAVVLAASTSTFTNGNGYAVVYGGTEATKRYKLVSYSGGLDANANITDIVTNTAAAPANPNNYVSIRVTYNPGTNTWALYFRDDGNSAWSDPSTGVNTQIGSNTVNSTYTGTALTNFGYLFNYSTAGGQNAQFDNFSVSVSTDPYLSASVSSLAFGNQIPLTNSVAQTFTINAANLSPATGNITVDAPNADFEVSNDGSSWFSSTSIGYSGGSISGATVYVRFTPQSAGAKSGNLTFTGGSLSSPPTVALTGTGQAAANIKTWNVNNGNWNTAGSWTPSGVPVAGDIVRFNNSNNITVTVNTNPATLSGLQFLGSGTVTMQPGGGNRTININNPGSGLNISSSSTVTLVGAGNNDVTIAFAGSGNYSEISGNLNLNIASGDFGALNTNNSNTTVTGTLTKNGGTLTSNAANLVFANGGTYVHAMNGGAIATATWQDGSTCRVTGVTTTVPTVASFAQSFSNFEWDCTSQTSSVSLIGNLTTIRNNFNMVSSGSAVLQMAISGAIFTVSIGGNFTQSGGSLTLNTTSGSATVNINGNFTMSGGTLTRGSGTGSINFTGTSVQQFSKSGGTISGSMPFTVKTGATVDFGTSVLDGTSATFTSESGSTLITSNNAGFSSSGNSGSIQVGGTRIYNNAGSYEFRGSNTGTFTTTSNQVANLTFNRSAGVTIDRDFTVTGTLNLQDGIVTTGANAITVNASGNISNASSSNYINGRLNQVYNSTSSKTFPIGKGGNYRPVTLEYLTLTGTSTVSTEQFESALPGTLPANTNLFTDRHWDVSQTGGSAFTYRLTLDANGYTPNGDVVILRNQSGTVTSNPTTTPNYTNSSGLNAFGLFALGSDCAAATTANAGPDQTDALTCGLSSVTLAANTPTYGTGAWSIISGTGGSFVDASDPATNFNGVNGNAYTLRWTVTNGNCSAFDDVDITLNANPVAGITNNSGFTELTCTNTSVSVTATGGATYSWDNGLGNNANASITTPGTYTVTVTSAAGCTDTESIVITQNITPPAVPGAITGPLDVCPHVNTGIPITYTSSPAAGAVSYVWAVPPGATIQSGQGTTSIDVLIDNSFAQTNQQFKIRAVAANGCLSDPSSLIVLKNIPAIPAAINGPTNACPFVGQPGTVTYSIAPVQYATSYTWTVQGTGISLVSGQGTTSVEVSFGLNFNTGNIRVTANSNCGNRSPRTLSISRQIPAAPTAINGQTNVCSFIGTNNPVTYTIDPVANATSYTWTAPPNATIVSGQGTTSVDVTFQTGFSTSVLKVKSVSNCFTSGDRQLTLTAASTSTPGLISGPTNACTFIGSMDEATYIIRKVTNAVSYNWTVPTGATITSHPAGLGANDTIITVAFDNSFVSGTNISVQAVNCNTSSPRNFTVYRNTASTPGLISGPVNVCEYKISPSNPSGTTATYTIRKVANALSYNWTAPVNASITAHPAGPGVNDTIVEVTFNSNFVNGSIQVSATNGCGTSTNRSLSLTTLNPGTPGGIDVVQVQACPNRVYTYSIAALPSNATSINWTVPSGGTITSGQGSTSITVSYANTAISGTVSAQALNNCGNSSIRNLTVKLSACPEGVFAGKGKVQPVMADQGLELELYPNPSTEAFRIQARGLNQQQTVTVRLLDLQGRELKRWVMMPSNMQSFGADLKAGTYLLELSQGKRRQVARLIKQ